MSLRGPARPAGIVVAVPEEANAILSRMLARTKGRLGKFPFWRGPFAKREVGLIMCGPGEERAAEAARLLVDRQGPSVLISAGFSGGLKEGHFPGDILFGTRILPSREGGEVYEIEQRIMRGARAAMGEFSEQGLASRSHRREYRAVEATLLTQPRIVVTAKDKARLGETTGADGVDMESRGVVSVARAKGLPWVAVRAVSDSVDQDLPLDFNEFLTPSGDPDRLRIFLKCLTTSGLFGKLMALRRTTKEVGQDMTLFLELLLRELIGGG